MTDNLRLAKTELTIQPQGAQSNFAGSGDLDQSLNIDVIATDLKLGREVWRGGFAVNIGIYDRTGGRTVDQRVTDGFIDSVLQALKKERLI